MGEVAETVIPILFALVTAIANPSPMRVHYTLRVELSDLRFIHVQIRIADAPDTLVFAAAAHPEYDDKYWRYIDGFTTNGTITKLDSVRWKIATKDHGVVVQYRVRLPAVTGQRAAWRAFLTDKGGLVGGPHSFLYLIGHENDTVHVTLDLPDGWNVATGLADIGQRVFDAPGAQALEDSPILVGQFDHWRFYVDSVPHDIAYLRTATSAGMDTAKFVGDVARYVRQAAHFWGMMPYRHYVFQLEDDAYGSLEHQNSVTLGGTDLNEIAHEFFHTWNLMYITPVEYLGVDYRTQPPVAGLWFSEGFTMYYADVLMRRAGLQPEDSTRVAHVEEILSRYLESPGNRHFSAEQGSRGAYNASEDFFGDYDASTHTQGEVIATALDLLIRGSTNDAKSLDDVMHEMLKTKLRFAGRDVQTVAESVCHCAVAPLFNRVVYNGGDVDMNRYLAFAGMRYRVVTRDSSLDKRVYAWQDGPGAPLRLRIWHPQGVWGAAGLHTGDELVSVNGATVPNWPAFRKLVLDMQAGDTARIVVKRPKGTFTTTVRMKMVPNPRVKIEPLPHATAAQLRVRRSVF